VDIVNNWIRKAISNLAKQSLDDKWYYTSSSKVNKVCPFCDHAHDASTTASMCDFCICPPEICASVAEEGYIADILEWFHKKGLDPEDKLVINMDDGMFYHMESLFKKWIIDGGDE
jgi:hypothetical protein